MVEHSMCQPGLPLPHGEPQKGSWGFAAFHSAKSLACRLSESTANDKWAVSGGNPEPASQRPRNSRDAHPRVRSSERQPHVSPASLFSFPRAGCSPQTPTRACQKQVDPQLSAKKIFSYFFLKGVADAGMCTGRSLPTSRGPGHSLPAWTVRAAGGAPGAEMTSTAQESAHSQGQDRQDAVRRAGLTPENTCSAGVLIACV